MPFIEGNDPVFRCIELAKLAAAFRCRRIAWVIARDKSMVEFLETGLESPRQ